MAQQVTVEEVTEKPTGGVFPPSEGGVVSVAEDGGEPKPVGEIPRKAAAPLQTDVVLSPDPVLGVSTKVVPKGDVAQAAGESVAKQVAPSFDSILESTTDTNEYMRLLSLQEDAEAGDADAQMRMLSLTEGTVPPGETVKPFTEQVEGAAPGVVQPMNRATLEAMFPTLVDPFEIDQALLVGQQQITLDNMLRETVPDARVRQILVENGLGNFGEVVGGRIAEAGRGGAQLSAMLTSTSPLNTAAYYGGLAFLDWYNGRASSFGAAYASYSAEIQRDSERNLDQLQVFTDAIGLSGPTIGRATDAFVKDQLRQKLEDGLMTQEEFDSVVYETTADGQRIEKTLVDEATANNILQLSMNELPLLSRFGAIAAENVVTMAGFGVGKAVKGRDTLRKVRNLKEQFPELLKGIEDPERILSTVQAAGKARRINKKFLMIGLREERLDATVVRLSNDIEKLEDDLANMRLGGASVKGHPKYAEYIAKSQESNLLKTRMLKGKFMGRTLPLVAENVENSLVISAGQLAAREFLPSFTGLESDTSEFMGALVMSLGGYKVTKTVGKAVAGGVLRTVEGNTSAKVTGSFGRVMDFLAYVGTGGEVGRLKSAQGKALFGDETIEVYEKGLDRKLTADERRGITYASRLIQNMSPDQRELVFKAQEQYFDIQNRIVNRFPQGDAREQAKELFTLSFAQGASLGPLAALNRLETGRMSVRSLKDMDAETLRRHTEATEKQIDITETALDNFDQLLRDTDGVTGKEQVATFILNARNALKQHQRNTAAEAQDQLAALDELETAIFSDIATEIPSDFFSTLLSQRRSLHRQIGKSFDTKEEIIRLQQVFQEGLENRVNIVRGMRGRGAQHQIALASAAEDMIDTHVETLFATGRAAYEPVVEFAKNRKPIDMSPIVRKMIEQFKASKIENFFSAEGDFFSGKLGQQAQEVFQDMVDRVIPPEQMDEMRGLLRASGFDDKQLTDIEVAIRASDASDQLNIFAQANPYEVEVMRRAVRDMAFRLDPLNERNLKRVATDFTADLDNLIKTQDSEVYEMLSKARDTYADEVGDRLRPNQFLTNVLNSREGPEKKTRGSNDPYRFLYGKVTPVSVFNPIAEAIAKIEAGGRGARLARQELPVHLANLRTIFGERVDVGDGTMDTVFDLTTDAGRSKFNTLQKLVSEQVYTQWGEKTIAAIKQPRPTQTSLARQVGGYDFKNSSDWTELETFLQVPVKEVVDGQVKVRNISIVKTGEMISSERDIVRLMDESIQIKNKYDKFVKEVTTQTSQLRRDVATEIEFDRKTFDDLAPILRNLQPDSFYTDFVLNGSQELLDTTRERAVALLVKGGMDIDEAADSFDYAAKSLVTRALMERGGLQNVQGRTVTGLNKQKKVVREFTTPQNMLQDIQENRELLDNIMGKDHVDYLEEITEFLNMTAKSEVGRASFEGLVKAYGTNEALSRVYNIARGMVSPLYVTSEFAVRLAAQANVEMLQLAGKDQNAARIMTNMLKYPELLTRQDMDYFDGKLVKFVVGEILKRPTTYQQAASLADMLGSAGETTTQEKDQ